MLLPYPNSFPQDALLLMLDKIRGKDVSLPDLVHAAWNVLGYGLAQSIGGGQVVAGEIEALAKLSDEELLTSVLKQGGDQTVDGQNVAAIGIVPQDTVLFDGTIRDNLLLVKPDASAAELIGAARIACAHDFIMGLPKGYNSDVGERGAGLSGGQRQRLALARAVLQNPRMLILDEATSALDARTERQVCLNLLEAFRGRTVFFITHRLTTVQPADMIVLMDRGAVMEAGTHQVLMARMGWYYALYQSQQHEQGL